MDEGELLRLVARGDRAAFEEFYRRTSPWLAVRLRRRCADVDVDDEVLQDSYLAVWRAAGAFVEAGVGGSALGWLWTIAARRLVEGRLVFRGRPADLAAAADGERETGDSPTERGYSALLRQHRARQADAEGATP